MLPKNIPCVCLIFCLPCVLLLSFFILFCMLPVTGDFVICKSLRTAQRPGGPVPESGFVPALGGLRHSAAVHLVRYSGPMDLICFHVVSISYSFRAPREILKWRRRQRMTHTTEMCMGAGDTRGTKTK